MYRGSTLEIVKKLKTLQLLLITAENHHNKQTNKRKRLRKK